MGVESWIILTIYDIARSMSRVGEHRQTGKALDTADIILDTSDGYQTLHSPGTPGRLVAGGCMTHSHGETAGGDESHVHTAHMPQHRQ